MRVLTPSENKRLNELIGFVGLSVAILLALSLLSYSPSDPSLNVSASAPSLGSVHNWIGLVGAYLADALFQLAGYAAFLFPAGMFILAMRWFRSQPIDTPIAKLVGWALMVGSLSAEFSLVNMPEVRGSLPSGGVLGRVLADGLRAAFNPVGANLVAIATLLAALLLATRFSFRTLLAWMKKPMAGQGPLGKLLARAKEWREEREAAYLRKQVEETKIVGRKPIIQQRVSPKVTDEDEEEEEKPAVDFQKPALGERGPAVIDFHDAVPAPPKKSSAEPKISRNKTAFRLPPTILLHPSERSEKMSESELKECARAIEQKCAEFDVGGHVTQINPGPVVTTFEFKPEAGIKYSRITGLAEDLCLALRAESILIERIPGKSTVGIEVPNAHRETIALRDIIESPEFSHSPSKLTLPLGKDLIGRIRATDSDADAALADRRFHRHGQKRLHQFPADGHALQVDAGRIEVGAGRSEAAGTGALRGYSAPLHAGGHRRESGGERPAERHARNGAAPEAAGAAQRPQHRAVQPHIREGAIAFAL